MKNIEPISTYSLELTELEKEDAKHVHIWMKDPVQVRYLDTSLLKTVESAEWWVDERIKRNESNEQMTWLITSKDSIPLGWISAKEIQHGIYLISFLLNRAREGNGYMREAVNGVIDFLFGRCHADTIMATCHPRNQKGEDVLKNVGMHRVWARKQYVDEDSKEPGYLHCYIIEKFNKA